MGFLLLALALFHSFYFSAKGGAAVVSTLVTVGLAMTVAVGSVSVDALLAVAGGLTIGAVVGAVVAFLSHAMIPDPPLDSQSAAQANARASIPLAVARRNHALVPGVGSKCQQYGCDDQGGLDGAGSCQSESA